MVADETNTGWYYKNFPVDAKSVLNTNESKGQRTIKPGETLITFSNNTYQDQGYSLHRCPHHLEPGIPLFDYEDREGWIVYDPTSDPIWSVHDDMPEIENIEFKVYTQFELLDGIRYMVSHQEKTSLPFGILKPKKAGNARRWEKIGIKQPSS